MKDIEVLISFQKQVSRQHCLLGIHQNTSYCRHCGIYKLAQEVSWNHSLIDSLTTILFIQCILSSMC